MKFNKKIKTKNVHATNLYEPPRTFMSLGHEEVLLLH